MSREVVPRKPHPGDLKLGDRLTELSYQGICAIVSVAALTFPPQEIRPEREDSIVCCTQLIRFTLVSSALVRDSVSARDRNLRETILWRSTFDPLPAGRLFGRAHGRRSRSFMSSERFRPGLKRTRMVYR